MEAISPELVLIDPKLAYAERARLANIAALRPTGGAAPNRAAPRVLVNGDVRPPDWPAPVERLARLVGDLPPGPSSTVQPILTVGTPVNASSWLARLQPVNDRFLELLIWLAWIGVAVGVALLIDGLHP